MLYFILSYFFEIRTDLLLQIVIFTMQKVHFYNIRTFIKLEVLNNNDLNAFIHY
jgi:hypothetical protein